MTRLLVSVGSLDEARLAAAAGVDLIDLKEPRLGSLGRVALNVARDIAGHLHLPSHSGGGLGWGRIVPSPTGGGLGWGGVIHGGGNAGENQAAEVVFRPVLSMALGELIQWTPDDFAVCRDIPSGIEFAKLGLAGCAGVSDWRLRWRQTIESLPPLCRPVAVVYADWREAEAPDPQAIVTEAAANGCRALLIDTCRKDRGDVFSHFSSAELRRLFDEAANAELLTVLAGSLSLRSIETALALEPDYIAIRGAVCDGPRDGHLCPAKLRQWRTIVSDALQGAARRTE